MLDGMCIVYDSELKLAGIAVDSMLHNERVSTIADFWQILEEWADIFGPEDKAVHHVGRHIDSINLSPIRVDHFAIASPQTVHEPLAVKCRYVGFIAR